MCVIMVKPNNVAFPEERILKNCWENNPDMGGFMYAKNGKVHIHKGYDTWERFKTALDRIREIEGDEATYVLHFRISTQGYDNSCCQPFPLSGNMNNLKRCRSEANIGVAHNGILSLTSDGSKNYSDTMLFITDYLVNIIRSYDWYKDNRTVKLIENLIYGSRFAILDKTGMCKTLGSGWIEDMGCFFSNSTYSHKKVVYTTPAYERGLWSDYYWDKNEKCWKYIYGEDENEDDSKAYDEHWKRKPSNDPWSFHFNYRTGKYNFDESYCPYSMEDDDSYCSECFNCNKCTYVTACRTASK